jgi:hypothetical protein
MNREIESLPVVSETTQSVTGMARVSIEDKHCKSVGRGPYEGLRHPFPSNKARFYGFYARKGETRPTFRLMIASIRTA